MTDKQNIDINKLEKLAKAAYDGPCRHDASQGEICALCKALTALYVEDTPS